MRTALSSCIPNYTKHPKYNRQFRQQITQHLSGATIKYTNMSKSQGGAFLDQTMCEKYLNKP